jgi:hypothetical protein
MGVTDKRLQEEKTLLQKSFDSLNQKIQTYEKETQVLRNNLNAVHGALQQIEKLIVISAEDGLDMTPADKAAELINKKNWPEVKRQLEIKEKEEAKLLVEQKEKLKKVDELLGEGKK